MFRTALRNVVAHKGRLLMTTLSVLLGVAFVSGTLILSDSVGRAFENSSEKSFEDVSVAIRAKDDGAETAQVSPNRPPEEKTTLGQELLDRVRALPGAARVTGDVSGFTAVADKNGDPLDGGWGSASVGMSNRGSSHAGVADLRYPIREGRIPLSADEVAVDAKTAERAGFETGDTILLSVSGPVLEQKLVGIFTTDDGSVAAGGTLALFDTATAQKLFSAPGEYHEILVEAAAGTSQAALKAKIDKILPEGVEAVTGRMLADEQAEKIAGITSGIDALMLTFAGVSLFVSIFIIANTFTMLVAQRTRELALLRAVGATRRQVSRSVLLESLVIGTVSAATGFALGVLTAIGMRSSTAAMGGTLPDGPLVIAPRSVLAALFVGVTVTMLAAWLPARRAARIPPVAAMNSVNAAPTTRSLVVRNSIGALLAMTGVTLVLTGALREEGPLTGIGAAVTMVGVIVLTPLLSRPAIAAAAPFLRLFGVSGRLARQNAVRNPRRTAATAAALMIGLTLIAATTMLAVSFQKGIGKLAADSIEADYTISMANFMPLSEEVARTLQELPEVTAISPLRPASVKMDGKSETVTGVSPGVIDRLVTLDFIEGSLAGLTEGTAVVERKTAEERGWKTGDTVRVVYGDDAAGELTIAGVHHDNAVVSGIMLPVTTLEPHLSQAHDTRVMVGMASGESERSKEIIRKALGDSPVIKIQTAEEISEELASAVTLMLNMLYRMLAMAVVIAVIGVVNTLAMSVFERSREIGMLRAIGLDRRRVKRMVRLESLVISLFGAVLGIGLGAFLAWAAGELLKSDLTTYSVVVPWDRFALFLGIAALVGILAATGSARRAARLNVLAAIKTE